MIKKCKYCLIILNEDNLYASDQKVSFSKNTLYNLNKTLKLKSFVFKEYGNSCECCSENIWQFLTIDHINNWGAQHRKNEIGLRGGKAIYQWLKNNNYPKDNFRLLCYNCNCCIGFHGYCSHDLITNTNNCVNCNALLNDNNWYLLHKFGNLHLCKDCCINNSTVRKTAINETKKYRSLHQRRKDAKNNIRTLRLKLIVGYDSKCNCCGEDNPLFLTIDHINKDGFLDKKKFKNNMYKFYNYLIDNNFPTDNYRLLCYNCNCSRGAYGQCYHELCKLHNKNNISIAEYKDITVRGLNG
jgi:hypothetical protein